MKIFCSKCKRKVESIDLSRDPVLLRPELVISCHGETTRLKKTLREINKGAEVLVFEENESMAV